MERRKTLVENIEHPDHAGVVGDLIRYEEDGKVRYRLMEYDSEHDRFVPYSVPAAWAREHDTTPTLRDEKREITGRDVILQAHAAARVADEDCYTSRGGDTPLTPPGVSKEDL